MCVMLKSYVLIYDFSLSTPVDVDGRSVRIEFSGGSKSLRQNGEFCTSDEKLQEAIEHDVRFGRVFKLSKVYEQRKDERGVDESVLERKVFRTVNEASEWLVGEGCRKSDVLTSEKAVAAARVLGYDLRFDKGE